MGRVISHGVVEFVQFQFAEALQRRHRRGAHTPHGVGQRLAGNGGIAGMSGHDDRPACARRCCVFSGSGIWGQGTAFRLEWAALIASSYNEASRTERRNDVSHIVIYTDSRGDSVHRECNGITEAAAIVEALRNDNGISDARIYSLSEIKYAIRTAYRVEVTDTAAPAVADAAPAPEGTNGAPNTPPVVAAAPPPPAEAAAPEPAAQQGASAFTAFAAEPPPPPPPPAAAEPAEEAAPAPPAAPARRGLFGR